jgi:hypothetical protein
MASRGRGVDSHTREMLDYLQIRAGKECSVEDLGTASGLDREQVQSRMLRLVRKGEHPVEVVKPGCVWRYIKAKEGRKVREPEVKESEYLTDVRKDENRLSQERLADATFGTDHVGIQRVVDALVQEQGRVKRLDTVERGLQIAYTVMGHTTFMNRLAYVLVVNEVPDFDGKAQ